MNNKIILAVVGVIVIILCLCGRCAIEDSSSSTYIPTVDESVQPSTKKTVVVKKTPKPKKTKAEEAYYDNCNEAWEKGAAPIAKGQPGYRKGLDRNSDGIACEL